MFVWKTNILASSSLFLQTASGFHAGHLSLCISLHSFPPLSTTLPPSRFTLGVLQYVYDDMTDKNLTSTLIRPHNLFPVYFFFFFESSSAPLSRKPPTGEGSRQLLSSSPSLQAEPLKLRAPSELAALSWRPPSLPPSLVSFSGTHSVFEDGLF